MLMLFITITSFAQTKTTRVVIDQNTVVKDESGMIMPYIAWKKIISGGEHSLKPVAPGSAEFVLYKMSPEEKAKNAERKRLAALNMPKPRVSDAFKEGDKFDGEKLTDLAGTKFDLRETGNKIYVINFWFINCPPCKQEIPELNQMVERYKDQKDVVFIAIALDDKTDLKNFIKTSFIST